MMKEKIAEKIASSFVLLVIVILTVVITHKIDNYYHKKDSQKNIEIETVLTDYLSSIKFKDGVITTTPIALTHEIGMVTVKAKDGNIFKCTIDINKGYKMGDEVQIYSRHFVKQK